MDSSEKLLPCPFCGGEASIQYLAPPTRRTSRYHPYSVWCFKCNCGFGWDNDYGGQFDSPEKAAEAWNRRAADVRPVVRGKWKLNRDGSGTCSECGVKQCNCWDLENWDNFCHHCGADMR